MDRTCPACGTPLSNEYRYCLNCGRDGGEVTIAVEEPPPTLVYQGAPPSSPNKPVVETTSTPRKSALPWILLGACLVVIGILAGLLVFGPFKRNDVASNPSLASSTETPTLPATATPEVALNSSSNTNTLQSSATLIPRNTNTTEPTSPSPSPSPKEENQIYSASEVDQTAKILSKPGATYTEEARANNVQGTVVLKVVLMSDGSVAGIRVIRGLPHGLTERAVEAARQLKFTRAIKNGHEVSMSTQVEYAFNLY